MKIKEVESLLSVSRSNIRFYEKEGLLTPERNENNYRDYSEQDVSALKKILALRKLGFSVEEILSMQRGELAFPQAASNNIARLEREIEDLKEALEITKTLSKDETSYDSIDQNKLWADITNAEKKGQSFVDICRDYLRFERNMFESYWRYYGFDFRQSRRKYGLPIACGIVLLLCVIRGLAIVVLWQESFWGGFLEPFMIFVIVSLIILPIYFLGAKRPKIAGLISSILLVLCFAFLALIVIGVIYCIVCLLVF